jgi:hypothetical protein
MVLDSMKRALGAVGVYDLSAPTLSAELRAYADELERLYTALAAIPPERFLSTAGDEGLSAYERLFGPVRSTLSLSERRQRLKKRFTLGGSSFTPAAIAQALDSFGLSYIIDEHPAYNRLNIIAQTDYTEAEQAFIAEQVGKIIPAHIECQMVFNTLMWSELDARDKRFSELDNDNLTWEQIDALD